MVIYTDENGIIYDVGENTTGNENLIRVEINDEENPFTGWSKGRICCYKCQVIDGRVVMMTPYIDSSTFGAVDLLDGKIERITPYKETKTAYIEDAEIIFANVPDGTMSVSVKDSDGNYPNYTTERTSDKVTFHFSEPLSKVTTITISVL